MAAIMLGAGICLSLIMLSKLTTYASCLLKQKKIAVGSGYFSGSGLGDFRGNYIGAFLGFYLLTKIPGVNNLFNSLMQRFMTCFRVGQTRSDFSGYFSN